MTQTDATLRLARERELRQDVQHALEAIYSGADHEDAAALIDQLEDLNLRIVRS